jgi:hypothetical protein
VAGGGSDEVWHRPEAPALARRPAAKFGVPETLADDAVSFGLKNERQAKNGQDAKSKHRHCGRIIRGQHEHGHTFVLSGAGLSRFPNQETHRPKMCDRLGSATRLKADSHPIGGRDRVVTTGDDAFEACLGASGKRSPLWV